MKSGQFDRAKRLCRLFVLLLVAVSIAGCETAASPQADVAVPKTQPYVPMPPSPSESWDMWHQYASSATIYFAYDSAILDPNAQAILDTWVQALKSGANIKLRLVGHCDERGTREYNLALGERRAEAARRYLIAHGIQEVRLKTSSYGKDNPTVLGSGEDVWAKNRNAIAYTE